ncbi:uncharacterized protein LOC119432462 [Dermacentor silvarum]|uniref:uncharacterized protein LOC119432462 n=1 Tax=Dermacentor silvarum TaxID=543639 RepID=UPI001899E67B|nr:uncharacterized protein LOC119432462 [Dermacentor silvarum]
MVPPYHPASNGVAEQVVQTIKDKHKKSKAEDFRKQVSRVLFHYRSTPYDVTGRAPWELLLGRIVKTPLDVLHWDLRSTALLKQLKLNLAANRGCPSGPLPESGAPVFARHFRPRPPWSAGQVPSPASASSLLFRMPDGYTWHRHADQVRPCLVTQFSTSGATSEIQPAGGPTIRAAAASEASPVVRRTLGHYQGRSLRTLWTQRDCLRQHPALPHPDRRHLCPGGVLDSGGRLTDRGDFLCMFV